MCAINQAQVTRHKSPVCFVSRVRFVRAVGNDDQFEEKKSPVISFSNIGSQCRFVRFVIQDSKFLSDLSSHIQYKCENVKISDLMKIGAPVTINMNMILQFLPLFFHYFIKEKNKSY